MNMKSSRFGILILFAFPLMPLIAETLEKQMGPEQFEKAGLHKLDSGELACLTDWIALMVENNVNDRLTSIIPRQEDSFGATNKILSNIEKFRNEPDQLESRIAGAFRGWSGDTIFRLENGQIWRQVGGGRFVVRMEDPRVTIKRGSLGSYFLSVEGYGSRVKVARID